MTERVDFRKVEVLPNERDSSLPERYDHEINECLLIESVDGAFASCEAPHFNLELS